jgi:flagellar basal body-associated protein FliL
MNNLGKINILVIIIIILVQAMLFGGLFVWFFVIGNQGDNASPQMRPVTTLERTEVAPAEQPRAQQRNDRDRDRDRDRGGAVGFGARDFTRDFTLFNLDDIIVNPAGVDRFFITSLALEHRQADRNLPVELRNKTPMIKDALIGYFSRRTVEELRDIDNREMYRDDVMRLINGMLIEGRITNVVFQQWVIQ